jgi:putative transposase
VFVKINGETHYLWRAVDHEGEVLEVFATKRRDRQAALKFLKRAMKRDGGPHSIVTDRLRSYRAATRIIGVSDRQERGRWLNNRAENSHQPFRRREGAMTRFRDIKTLQKFASAHFGVECNYFANNILSDRSEDYREGVNLFLMTCPYGKCDSSINICATQWVHHSQTASGWPAMEKVIQSK